MSKFILPDPNNDKNIQLSNLFDKTSLLIPVVAGILAISLLIFPNLNQSIFLTLNQFGTTFSQSMWANLTILGDSLVVMSFFLVFVYWRPQLVWGAILGALVATVYIHGLKHLLEFARPAAVLDKESFRIIGPTLLANSFPSGHSATTMFVAGIFWFYLRPLPLKLSVVILSLLVALSRVMVGAHWPCDILGGAFGGWISAYLGIYLSQRFTWGNKIIGQRIIAILLLVSVVYLLFWHNTRYADAHTLQVIIALSSLLISLPGLYNLFFNQNLKD